MTLIAYFDASGTDDQTAMSVAGCIATPESWEAFNRDWTLALTEWGVPEFHMRQFAHSVGVFGGWKGQEDRRRAFLGRLISIIKQHTAQTVGVAHFLRDYRQVDAVFNLRDVWGAPYTVTTFCALIIALNWRDALHAGAAIAFKVEKGDKDQWQLGRLLKRLKFAHSFEILPKRPRDSSVKDVHAFQAADLLAWEIAKGARDVDAQGGDEIKARKSLQELAPHGPNDYWRYIDVRALLALGRPLGLQRR
jgi:hypothetical protein